LFPGLFFRPPPCAQPPLRGGATRCVSGVVRSRLTVRISTAEHLSPGAPDEHVIRGETDAATEEALLEKARP